MSVLFLPGLNASGPAHWQSRWLRQMPDAHLVEQTNWDDPDLGDWVAKAADAVIAYPNSVLVGHSLGAVLITHLAARHHDLPIAGALLVAPADVEGDHPAVDCLGSFKPLPLEPFDFPSVVVASRNDPFIAFERARVLANMWEAGFIDLGDSGHINAESGHGPWPEGQRLLERFKPKHQRFDDRRAGLFVADNYLAY
jgi:predicted alpha/beta hydrolase family esterase